MVHLIDGEFDIMNDFPRLVKCVRSDDDVWKTGGDPTHKLKVGETYTVCKLRVYDDYTLVSVDGIDGWFNSVLFNELDGYKYVDETETKI